MILFWKRWVLTFWPLGSGEGVVFDQYICYHVAAFAIPLNMIMQYDHFLKKVEFWHIYPVPSGQNSFYNAAAFAIPFNLICNMAVFSPPQSPRVVGEGGGDAGKSFATMLLHFVMPFNLTCSITMFWKSWISAYWPHPQGFRGLWPK